MYEIFLTTFSDEYRNGWGSRQIFWKVFNLDVGLFRAETHPVGGFVLENFLTKKKKVAPKTPIFFIDFQKIPEDFLKKQNYRGSAAQIFFSLVVEKPW